jgi:hypothetical protein
MEVKRMEINHKELVDLVLRGYETEVPLDVKGKPGIGKSEEVCVATQLLAEKTGRKWVHWNRLSEQMKEEMLERCQDYFLFVDIRLSNYDQTDLKGFPNATGDFAKWVPTLLFKVLSNPDAKGVVFFDELNLASPSTVASAYSIINDHLIGETPISKGVYFVSAGNNMSDTNNAFDDPAPLNNRRMNVQLKVPVTFDESGSGNDWFTWASNKGVDGRILGFNLWKNTALFQYDAKSKDPSFPSPRSWYKASKLIQGVTDDIVLKRYVGACVGEAMATEFIAFALLSDKIDVKSILKKPELIQKYADKPDVLHSIIGSIAEMYRDDDTLLNQILLVSSTKNMSPEFGMYMLRIVKAYSGSAHKRNFAEQLATCSNWKLVEKDFRKYVLGA